MSIHSSIYSFVRIPISYLNDFQLGQCSSTAVGYYFQFILLAAATFNVTYEAGFIRLNVKSISLSLRRPEQEILTAIEELENVGLLIKKGIGYEIKKYWDEQYALTCKTRNKLQSNYQKIFGFVSEMQGGSFCKDCGGTNDLALDHIIPVICGGSNMIDNLQILCKKCNSSKKDKIL